MMIGYAPHRRDHPALRHRLPGVHRHAHGWRWWPRPRRWRLRLLTTATARILLRNTAPTGARIRRSAGRAHRRWEGHTGGIRTLPAAPARANPAARAGGG